eukprot:2428-Heterococcus_DN1.PRE.3
MQQATAKEVGLIQKQRKFHVYIGCIYHRRAYTHTRLALLQVDARALLYVIRRSRYMTHTPACETIRRYASVLKREPWTAVDRYAASHYATATRSTVTAAVAAKAAVVVVIEQQC